ncbi:hypothetical protein Fmac_005031 [Flemingia macrophylla]|uniref:Uncharacterized protein n=1 Tax=Flemingia macrophylla TaxID=520843 RepID=A0ABD1N6N6_9FABA
MTIDSVGSKYNLETNLFYNFDLVLMELYHKMHALDRFDQDYRCKFQEEDNSNATLRVPMIVVEGNHEIEPQAGEITFQSYLTQFGVPVEKGDSESNLYYSFDVGSIHDLELLQKKVVLNCFNMSKVHLEKAAYRLR